MLDTEKDKYEYIHKLDRNYSCSKMRERWIEQNERLSREVKSILSESRTALDVGCGKGYIIDIYKSMFSDLIISGIEISEEAVKARPDLNIRCGDVRIMPYKDNHFDAVYFYDGLEHIPSADIRKAIFETIRVSKRWVVFKIAHRESNEDEKMKKAGYSPLHLTVKPWDFWARIFSAIESLNIARVERSDIHRAESIYILRKDR